MKKLILIFAVFVVLLSSCKKNYTDNEILPENKNMTNLVVNDNFDWKTSTDFEVVMISSTTGVLRINSTNGINYHKGLLTSGVEYNTKVNIPSYVNEIDIVFNGNTHRIILENNNTIEFNLN